MSALQLPILAILDASVVAAAIAAFAAVVVYVLGLRQAAQERKRRTCAEAVADALKWLELPYRIRRRQDNSKETIGGLAQQIHHLQERLLFHENWLRIELPEAYAKYRDLVIKIKDCARNAIQEAWNSKPIEGPEKMDIGDLGLEPVDSHVADFTDEVGKQLSFWRFGG